MIYARIIKSKNLNSKAEILHFYGEKKETYRWSSDYRSTINEDTGKCFCPLDFLGQNNFLPSPNGMSGLFYKA